MDLTRSRPVDGFFASPSKWSQKDEVEVSSGRIRMSIFLFWTGGILVDESIFFLAEDGLKGATATRAVAPFIFRPVGIPAV